ncbi:MAG: peptide chain release factor N(5)-glutamine methyltransferase [Prevotella sp.]|nr:peptide chain release factor N(5)-glutamine methyltransferase [Prevotella sp.]MBQ8153830.1 peptide chain release factor N(5)-glutamine methyltransferase [Prevotella sp.]
MTYQELWHRLAKVYDEGEAKAIARIVYEVRYDLSFSDLLMGRDTEVPVAELEQIALRLEQHEPVQYVLGQTDFCGHTFLVNEHVLIPRPETEELCRWILSSLTGGQSPYEILDIGTGSGNIAITLSAGIPNAHVSAWDISSEALAVARENAQRNHVQVAFERVDILNPHLSTLTPPSYDLIVSNPPYITNKEREEMDLNVLDYEPHTALFVPDEDPLRFYRAIATFGQTALRLGGWLYFEINPLYANALCEMLRMMSWHDIETKDDQFDKPRFIRAQR